MRALARLVLVAVLILPLPACLVDDEVAEDERALSAGDPWPVPPDLMSESDPWPMPPDLRSEGEPWPMPPIGCPCWKDGCGSLCVASPAPDAQR